MKSERTGRESSSPSSSESGANRDLNLDFEAVEPVIDGRDVDLVADPPMALLLLKVGRMDPISLLPLRRVSRKFPLFFLPHEEPVGDKDRKLNVPPPRLPAGVGLAGL